ncbi:putative AAA domain-containing protein [Colletotrichum liriopes]|uniref:AAA domain-containing protein n=1 Tax=Colletotrichum liriopes TaxID=708192 RepID=A0AA37GAM0_9PEZI|nr:putative AAA domain-containing protein [Colletotrichum liriopes]
MLPSGYKNLILSFMEGQNKKGKTFDDIIEGKGQGIIMLLTGNSGIGKTLTAEAVADKLRKPLYVLSAGELGQESQSVEAKLREVLDLTEKWNGVLLFDECDVFLQERSTNALAHNEIVAVFLRLLEYHCGILIMTTNRADSIDRAFQSRIHLTLHYLDLDVKAREHIWR